MMDPIIAIAVGTRVTLAVEKTSLLYHYTRIWDIAMDTLEIAPLNDYTPLWHNKNLPELARIPNSEIWSTQGIYYLHHLLSGGELKAFHILQEEFTLPSTMLFIYLQVRHALTAQFPDATPQPSPNSIIAIVKSTDPQKPTTCLLLLLPQS